VIVASQASRCTVALATTPAYSISPLGEPTRSRSVSRVVVTWMWERWLALCGTAPTSRLRAHSSTSASAQRCARGRSSSNPERRASGSSALRTSAPPFGVEEPGEGDAAIPARLDLQRAPLALGGLLGEEGVAVDLMAEVGADLAEAHHLDGLRLSEQPGLIEACCRRGGLLDGAGCAGDQGQMGEAEPSFRQREGALREPGRLLAHADRGGGGGAGHTAVLAHPGDRAGIVVHELVVLGGKPRCIPSEVELEAVDERALQAEDVGQLGLFA
jgi:hypothetical protein